LFWSKKCAVSRVCGFFNRLFEHKCAQLLINVPNGKPNN